ncbi:MAG: hydroxyacylglutathione hydrolase [Spongiibacteraceae bacterium]|nr:hydroxyacylglutathione hydrolase [Spongiibacteraceae bacterium]
MIKIDAITAFSDNYIWCIYDDELRTAVIVDPGDAAPVKAALAQKKLNLQAILITHHHADHTGGIDDLLRETKVPVYGPANKRITQITNTLYDKDTINIIGTHFQVITIPGHTLDHIAFYSNTLPANPILFCGDTLFAGGCGRIFEGTAAMMLESLSKIAQLPSNTVFYCAHEYTLANLKFALAVEPNNESLLNRIDVDTHRRNQGLATVPSTLAIEKDTNPFLRCELASVIQAAKTQISHEPANIEEVFGAIRGWKDNF